MKTKILLQVIHQPRLGVLHTRCQDLVLLHLPYFLCDLMTERDVKNPLFDGFTCSTCEYFASCVEFFRRSPQEENQQQKYKPFFLLFFDFLVEAYFLSSAIPNRQHVSSKWRQKKRKFTLKLNRGDVGKRKTLSLMDGDNFLLNHLSDWVTSNFMLSDWYFIIWGDILSLV